MMGACVNVDFTPDVLILDGLARGDVLGRAAESGVVK